MDFKVAMSAAHQEKIRNMVRRKQKQNYLSLSQPFDLAVILDQKYWKSKHAFIAEPQQDLKLLKELNRADVAEITFNS